MIQEIADLRAKDSTDVEEFAVIAWRSMYAVTPEAMVLPQYASATMAYVKEIALKLDAALKPSELLRDTDVEKCRRQAWQAILQGPVSFKDTGFAVVVDAMDPRHPVWLFYICN